MQRLSIMQALMVLLGSTFLSLPALAESIIWPSAVRVSDVRGQLLYSEDWLSAKVDGELSQWDILYRSANGEELGRRTLMFSSSAPYQPETRLELASGERVELLQGDRWTRSRYSADNPRAAKSWPDIRKHMTVDLALLRYLVENREAIATEDINQLSNFDLLSGRREIYKTKVLRRPTHQGEALTIKLHRGGLFSKKRLLMWVDMMRDSGRLLSAQGRHALLKDSQNSVNMQFFY